MQKNTFDPLSPPPGFRPKRTSMFDGLLSPEFTAMSEATIPQVLSAQAATVTWMEELGAPTDVLPENEARELARNAFMTVTGANVEPSLAKAALLAARTPEAVRRLAGMLSEYDWKFVEQADQIRGYIVAKLIEHSESPDARISLAAIKQLGTITEIGAFTERVEVTKRDATSEAVTQRLRERLERLKANVTDVTAKPAP